MSSTWIARRSRADRSTAYRVMYRVGGREGGDVDRGKGEASGARAVEDGGEGFEVGDRHTVSFAEAGRGGYRTLVLVRGQPISGTRRRSQPAARKEMTRQTMAPTMIMMVTLGSLKLLVAGTSAAGEQ